MWLWGVCVAQGYESDITQFITSHHYAVLHSEIVQAFNEAWQDPSKEDGVRKLWEEIAPGVFKLKLFDPEQIQVLREWFDKAQESGVPCRPPYGITLNRKGFMLDERSEGYLAVPSFQAFYRDLIDRYVVLLLSVIASVFPVSLASVSGLAVSFVHGIHASVKHNVEQRVRKYCTSLLYMF